MTDPKAQFPVPVHPSMETLDASSTLRQVYPEDVYPNGKYYSSPWGRTRYWILGPESGKKVVLIHGISAPSIVFKNVAPVLTQNGFQILLYDTFGRGYSEAPKIVQDPTVYAIQLSMLLQYIGWKKVDVAGFSMGGSIAAAFSASFPHLINERVAFLAAAGLMDQVRVDPSKASLPPVKNEVIPGSPDAGQLRDLQAQYLPGFVEILSSCVKDGCITGTRAAYESLAQTDKNFLIIHGTADQTVPFENAHRIQKAIPQAELFTVEGATHYLVTEVGAAEKVATKLSEFFA